MGQKASQINNENNAMPKTEKKEDEIVIGIDFGSSGIAFAYSFLNDEKGTPTGGYLEGKINNNKIST